VASWIPFLWQWNEFTPADLLVPERRIEIARYSPSFRLVDRLIREEVAFDDLAPRDFERVLGDMLEADGYTVELGSGRNDGGVDLFAFKDVPPIGFVSSVWQAKTKPSGNKIGPEIVRDLLGTVQLNGVNKGVIATTTHLTRGALKLVRTQKRTLEKVDRDDLKTWIKRLAND